MDRHVKWLRRRIVASVATQTAETFALVAVLAFGVMQWRTDEGPLTALFGSVVIAQLVAGARLGHAMRNNPLNYVFMRRYVDQPFSYRVARFQGEEDAHPVAAKLPGFAPVATIRDSDADPEPIFDVYHDPSRLVAASVSRASGSVSLISSLADGRILVTDARAMPPHERLVLSLADDDSLESVIATHRRALSARSDVVELASSAHQVVLDSLAIEYDSYVLLGPALSPFLDLEPGGKSWLRLIARIKPDELVGLPTRLGPDIPAAKARVIAPPAATPEPAPAPTIEPEAHTELNVPQVIAPQIAAPSLTVPEVIAPQIAAPSIATAEVVAPPMATADVAAPRVVAPEAVVFEHVEVVAPSVEVESVVAQVAPRVVAAEAVVFEHVEVVAPSVEVESVVAQVAPRVVAPEAAVFEHVEVVAPSPATAPSVEIAPPAFVTVEPEAPDFAQGEPVTAEVPAIVVADTPVETIELNGVVEAPRLDEAAVAQVVPAQNEPPAAVVPLDLAAAIASLATVPSIAPVPAPEPVSDPVAPVVAQEPSTPVPVVDNVPTADLAIDAVLASAPDLAAPAPVPTPQPMPIPSPVPVAVDVPIPAPAPVLEALSPVPPAAPAELAVVAPITTPSLPDMTAPPVEVPVVEAPTAQPVAEAPVFVHEVPVVEAPVFVHEVPVVEAPVFVHEVPVVEAPTAQPVAEALPDFILQPAPASLAEAVVSAPDTPAALGAPAAAEWPVDDGEPMLVSNLSAALGRSEELSPTRPRLSAVIRANAAPQTGVASGRRSRRKSR